MAATLLPVMSVSGMAIGEALSAYHRALEDKLLDTSRALAAAVERDFAARITTLETLATNPLLDLGPHGGFVGLPEFYERAVRAARVIGTPVSMIGPDGWYILHSERPFGADLPVTGAPTAVARVVGSARPLVGDLGSGNVNRMQVVPVLVPVVRDGRVVAVLNSPIPPAVLSRLLAKQNLSDGRYAAVLDAKGVVAARSSRTDEAVGRKASDWFLRSTAGKAEGVLQGRSAVLDEHVVLAFQRLDTAPDWIVVVAEPSTASAADARRPLLAFGVGGGSALLLALLGASWMGARVLRDVRRLEEQADALAADGEVGGGQHGTARRPALPDAGDGSSAVAEFRNLGRAMQRADTALRDREFRQTILVREVDHRSKNALAVVQSMVRLTPAADPRAFQLAVQGRIASLARTHSVLAKQGWRATDLHTLLEAELAPHGNAVSLDGPAIPVAVAAAQPIAMVAHELATNAAKHGALSVPDGTVSVAWWSQDGRLHLRWKEHGGPTVDGPPDRSGFGSRMIEANIKRQLGGVMGMVWVPSFVCDMSIPHERVLAGCMPPNHVA